MTVKTATFNGVKYEILVVRLYGFTNIKKDKKYTLVVCCESDTQKELISLVHEAMHAGNWDKHEETIDRSSKEIGRLLWRLGYRIKK